mgnify:CR=1 FL=1
MSDPDQFDYYDQDDYQVCPRCDGHRYIHCYCAGDFCVCDNQGEKECPFCGGDGEVENERAEAFLKREAETRAILHKAWEDVQP